MESAGELGKGPMGSPAPPSLFDAAYVRLLSQLKDRVHKLAMSGLRRPSGEGSPAANGDSTEQPQDDQGTITALQRCASTPTPATPVTLSVSAVQRRLMGPLWHAKHENVPTGDAADVC